jgi:hypothetical protein
MMFDALVTSSIDSYTTGEELLTNLNNCLSLVSTWRKFCQLLGMAASVTTHPHIPFSRFAQGVAHPSQT